MDPLDLSEVTLFVEENIARFHDRKATSLRSLRLKAILKRKNPYLFRAKNLVTAQDLVKSLLDAHLSSHEETIFGEFLEELAIFVCGKVFGGRKSSAEGIDLEFERDEVHYLASIKSGPNWGNSSQIKRMRDNFRKAERILRTNSRGVTTRSVNGCCYGKDSVSDKGDYDKLCGQQFWAFISGDPDLYVKIIEPLGYRARERNEDFQRVYVQIINQFTQEFLADFCHEGTIRWERLVQYNSAADHAG